MVGLGALFAAFVLSPSPAVAQTKPGVPSMGLGKTECYGSCPAYTVRIFADGRAEFEAKEESSPQDLVADEDYSDPVAVGRHEFAVSKSDAANLLGKFRAVGFFSLKDRYDGSVVDAPITSLTFSDGTQSKTIWDNRGANAGMPAALSDLQVDIYKISQVDRLSRGKAGLVEILIAERYDFHSPAAGRMLVRAIARQADPETIKGLLDQGVPLRVDWDGKSIGEWAVKAAVSYGDIAALRTLAARGELKRLSESARNELAASAPLCLLDRMKLLKTVGIDPVAAEKSGGRAVLAHLALCMVERPEVRDLVRYYLAQGADPNAANEDGETSIFGIWDVDAIGMLIDQGADVRRLNKDGQSAVFSTWNEDVNVRLLAAGTPPVGEEFGLNFWNYANSKKWSKVIAWLNAHPDVKAVAQGK